MALPAGQRGAGELMHRNVLLVLRMLAPYLAVGVFWCLFENAWLVILAYHAQIVLWALRDRPVIGGVGRKRSLFLAVPTLATGGLVYVLLPYITNVDLATWLTRYHLSSRSLLIMVPYFGVIHPFLEQLHWARLRDRTPAAHVLFAGYHMLVLGGLLSLPWLGVSFLVLAGASFAWQQMQKYSGGLIVPYLSHALADVGVILAAVCRI